MNPWWIVGVVVVSAIWLLVWRVWRSKHAVVKTDEYLLLLDDSEWKSGRTLKKDMETLKGGWLGTVEMYAALNHLRIHGFVMHREVDRQLDDVHQPGRKFDYKEHQFRLTPKGVSRKRYLETRKVTPASTVTEPA